MSRARQSEGTGAPTSADVARAAGVSTAAVSVALSGKEGSTRVSEETRRHIIQIANRLGYTPNPSAVALRTQRSLTTVFVSRPARSEPHEQAIPYILSTTASRAMAELGLRTLVVQPQRGGDYADIVSLILQHRAEGVLWDSPDSMEALESLLAEGVPTVMMMRPLDMQPSSFAASVTVDPWPGVNAAVSHLTSLGHRRLAFIGQRGPHAVDLARLAAFEAAIRDAGCAATSRIHRVADYSIEAGASAAREAIEDGATAVMTSSDGLTLGVLRFLYEKRLRVPEDINVLSFDDAAVADLYPPITTVTQPFTALARTAVDLLMSRIGGEADTDQTVVLPTELTVRSSTARRDEGVPA